VRLLPLLLTIACASTPSAPVVAAPEPLPEPEEPSPPPPPRGRFAAPTDAALLRRPAALSATEPWLAGSYLIDPREELVVHAWDPVPRALLRCGAGRLVVHDGGLISFHDALGAPRVVGFAPGDDVDTWVDGTEVAIRVDQTLLFGQCGDRLQSADRDALWAAIAGRGTLVALTAGGALDFAQRGRRDWVRVDVPALEVLDVHPDGTVWARVAGATHRVDSAGLHAAPAPAGFGEWSTARGDIAVFTDRFPSAREEDAVEYAETLVREGYTAAAAARVVSWGLVGQTQMSQLLRSPFVRALRVWSQRLGSMLVRPELREWLADRSGDAHVSREQLEAALYDALPSFAPWLDIRDGIPTNERLVHTGEELVWCREGNPVRFDGERWHAADDVLPRCLPCRFARSGGSVFGECDEEPPFLLTGDRREETRLPAGVVPAPEGGAFYEWPCNDDTNQVCVHDLRGVRARATLERRDLQLAGVAEGGLLFRHVRRVGDAEKTDTVLATPAGDVVPGPSGRAVEVLPDGAILVDGDDRRRRIWTRRDGYGPWTPEMSAFRGRRVGVAIVGTTVRWTHDAGHTWTDLGDVTDDPFDLRCNPLGCTFSAGTESWLVSFAPDELAPPVTLQSPSPPGREGVRLDCRAGVNPASRALLAPERIGSFVARRDGDDLRWRPKDGGREVRAPLGVDAESLVVHHLGPRAALVSHANQPTAAFLGFNPFTPRTLRWLVPSRAPRTLDFGGAQPTGRTETSGRDLLLELDDGPATRTWVALDPRGRERWRRTLPHALAERIPIARRGLSATTSPPPARLCASPPRRTRWERHFADLPPQDTGGGGHPASHLALQIAHLVGGQAITGWASFLVGEEDGQRCIAEVRGLGRTQILVSDRGELLGRSVCHLRE